jgi:NitT/TauT family transport system substrate-binding protein
MKKGWFRREGLEVRPQVAASGPAQLAAILSGSLHFGIGAYVTGLISAEQNVPIRYVANAGVGTVNRVMVRSDSPVRSIADLSGKLIGVNALRNVSQLALELLAARLSVDPASMRFVELPVTAMQVALDRGQVDAVIPNEPFVTLIQQSGGRSIAGDIIGRAFGYATPFSGWFTSASYAGDNLATCRRFAKVMIKAANYADSHAGEVRTILTTYTTLTTDLANEITLPRFGLQSTLKPAVLNRLVGLMRERGYLERTINTSQLISACR